MSSSWRHKGAGEKKLTKLIRIKLKGYPNLLSEKAHAHLYEIQRRCSGVQCCATSASVYVGRCTGVEVVSASASASAEATSEGAGDNPKKARMREPNVLRRSSFEARRLAPPVDCKKKVKNNCVLSSFPALLCLCLVPVVKHSTC